MVETGLIVVLNQVQTCLATVGPFDLFFLVEVAARRQVLIPLARGLASCQISAGLSPASSRHEAKPRASNQASRQQPSLVPTSQKNLPFFEIFFCLTAVFRHFIPAGKIALLKNGFIMSVKYKIRDQHGLNFLTCSIVGWIDLFGRAVYRDIILDSWRYCSEHKGLNVWGYVLMPNHLHLIASATPPFRLDYILRDFKARTARRMLNVLHDHEQVESRRSWLLYLFGYFARFDRDKQEFKIWQHDNHPIELFSEKVVLQKLQYIHENPVRAKLVAKPEDWMYSSASNYVNGTGIFDVKLLWSGFADDSWF
ncbi:MAG TPA: transposase [Saprospiraceae bacterium]|nr:transposase [Saprospiraceae bacterium]